MADQSYLSGLQVSNPASIVYILLIMTHVLLMTGCVSTSATPVDPEALEVVVEELDATDVPTPLPEPSTIPTDTPTPPPDLLATAQVPQIQLIRFCSIPCDQPEAVEMESFPDGTREIYFSWDYANMSPGIAYEREWRNRGESWVIYHCVWGGPERGTFARRLYDLKGGLRSGAWELRIAVEGELLAVGTVEVRGTNEYWDPFDDEDPPCPDW